MQLYTFLRIVGIITIEDELFCFLEVVFRIDSTTEITGSHSVEDIYAIGREVLTEIRIIMTKER